MRYKADTPGRLLREARIHHGVSQEQLAIRAGTTQSAISRIEKDRVSPTVQTLTGLLHLLGEDLVLEAEKRDTGIDLTLNRANLERQVRALHHAVRSRAAPRAREPRVEMAVRGRAAHR